MGKKLLANPWRIDQRRQFDLFDHFTEFTSGKTLTQTLGGGASSPTISATAQSGILSMAVTGATANDSIYVASTGTLFKWAANINCSAEVLLQYSEANTDDAGICFGFSSSVSATLMADSTMALPSSFTGALIYKIKDGTKWKTMSSQSTTQNDTTTKYTPSQSGYTRLRVDCKIVNSVMEATYFIDQGAGMEQMKDNTARQLPIKDTISLSSPSAMKLVVGVKNGGANAETLLVDYLAGWAVNGNFVASA